MYLSPAMKMFTVREEPLAVQAKAPAVTALGAVPLLLTAQLSVALHQQVAAPGPEEPGASAWVGAAQHLAASSDPKEQPTTSSPIQAWRLRCQSRCESTASQQSLEHR